ncbi:hypothetical protein N7466_010890 [Penicillium verhagenii]|uniref:uncharacterized protein n=1 Tax=Penicillium verhagenii TaxID=1562060 RepID=UPI002545832C|nr:uncharacterized protein N7466_010890 [Penicillium verhagenii]KAJ5917336.1 hypothetical protein N7466_010890 [Penicillium verhagenii]
MPRRGRILLDPWTLDPESGTSDSLTKTLPPASTQLPLFTADAYEAGDESSQLEMLKSTSSTSLADLALREVIVLIDGERDGEVLASPI